jgi:predicted transcriptional regulator of viral defense system
MVARGVFRLSDIPPLGNPDLVTVATRVPQGVICLISALSFHELTTQIPHEVHVALQRGAEEPRLDYPPIRTYRFTGEAFTAGVDTHELDGIGVHRRKVKVDDLMLYATICRVDKIMRPYLEAIL